MKKLTVKQALQLAAERDTDAFMEDMVHHNAHEILDLFVDLHAQLQQEREGREKLAEALSWYADQSVYEAEWFGSTTLNFPVMADHGALARAALTQTEVKL